MRRICGGAQRYLVGNTAPIIAGFAHLVRTEHHAGRVESYSIYFAGNGEATLRRALLGKGVS